MTHQELFARLVKALPRNTAEQMLVDHASEKRPWQFDRATLDRELITRDSDALRDDMLDYFTRVLKGTL